MTCYCVHGVNKEARPQIGVGLFLCLAKIGGALAQDVGLAEALGYFIAVRLVPAGGAIQIAAIR